MIGCRRAAGFVETMNFGTAGGNKERGATLVEAAVSHLGGLDIVVHNAGGPPAGETASVTEAHRALAAQVPGGQGVELWPAAGKNRTLLVDDRPGDAGRAMPVR